MSYLCLHNILPNHLKMTTFSNTNIKKIKVKHNLYAAFETES